MTNEEFEKGDQILYTSNNGEIELGVIMNIHYDDNPPYYTIKLLRDNKEKVTDGKNLTLLIKEEEDEEDEHHENENHSIGNQEIKIEKKVQEEQRKTDVVPSSNSNLTAWIVTTSLLFSIGLFISYKFYKYSDNSSRLNRS